MGLVQGDKAALNQAGLDAMASGWSANVVRGWKDAAIARHVKKLDSYLKSLEPLDELSDPTKAKVGARMRTAEEGAFWANAIEQGYGGNPPRIGKTGDTSYILNDIILKGRAGVNVPFSKSAKTVVDQANQALRAGGVVSQQDRDAIVRPLISMARTLRPSVLVGDRILEYGKRMAAGQITKLQEHHKTDMLAGMTRLVAPYSSKEGQTVEQEPSRSLRIWRRITQTSAPWIHPGFKAQNVAEEYSSSAALRELMSKLGDDVLDSMLTAATKILNSRNRKA